MISRRKGLTQLCSEKILIKLREHGHCISDKADIGDIDQKMSHWVYFGEVILQGCGR